MIKNNYYLASTHHLPTRATATNTDATGETNCNQNPHVQLQPKPTRATATNTDATGETNCNQNPHVQLQPKPTRATATNTDATGETNCNFDTKPNASGQNDYLTAPIIVKK